MQTEELWRGGPVLEQTEGVFRLGTDAVLIAHFAAKCAATAKTACDLGSGSGVISVLLTSLSERLRVDAVDIDTAAYELTRRNVELNGLEGRINAINADMRRLNGILPSGGYDLVIANPPYFSVGSGKTAEKGLSGARGEENCTLAELVDAAAFLTRSGGHFFVVYRPERLSELLVCLTAAGLEPKRMRLAAHRVGARPSVVLVEAMRGARVGMSIEPTLYLTEADGSDTGEMKKIYRR